MRVECMCECCLSSRVCIVLLFLHLRSIQYVWLHLMEVWFFHGSYISTLKFPDFSMTNVTTKL